MKSQTKNSMGVNCSSGKMWEHEKKKARSFLKKPTTTTNNNKKRQTKKPQNKNKFQRAET